MRQSKLFLLSVSLMLCCCRMAAAEESSWGWLWPFGHDEPAEQPYPTTGEPVAHPTARATDRAALKQKPGRRRVGSAVSQRPDFELPKVKLWPGKSEVDQTHNAWTEKKADPESASPWQVVTEGTERLGESTRNAWHKTVDVLTPEYLKSHPQPTERVAQRTPIWKRALGLGEEEKPEGPQTVTEWMAQERLNP